MVAIARTYTPDELAALGTHVTLPPAHVDPLAALRAENATLRSTLIEVTGQRDVLRRELDKALQERSQ